VAFRRKSYGRLEELQEDLDLWLREYNEVRPHQGRWCYGKTPLQTFVDSAPLAREKMLAGGRRKWREDWPRGAAVASATVVTSRAAARLQSRAAKLARCVLYP
jgi:hypothetical protein